jgi:hypothetical protein
MDPEAFLRYSVDDLWYASSDLERAMDLLAICRLDPGPAAGRPAVTDGAGLTEQGL